MDKKHIIRLTLAVYRVTNLFPRNESLKFKIQDKAYEILANLNSNNFNPDSPVKKNLLKNLEILNSYFELAQKQKWVDFRNFLVLCREYAKIRESLQESKPTETIKTEPKPPLLPEAGQKQEINPPKESRVLESMRTLLPVGARITLVDSKVDSKPAFSLQPIYDPREIKHQQEERQKKILEILKEKGKAQVWEFKKIFPDITKRTIRRDFEYLISKGLIERTGERNNTFYKPKGGELK